MKDLTLSLKTIRTSAAIAVLAVLVSDGQAQNREKFGISAKAGGVNSVTGRVMVTRTGQSPKALTDQDDLVGGDVVTTGQASQVEVLLNPGSYLRVAANSEFALVDNSLNNLVVRLIKGSAIIEVTGGDDADIRISVLGNRQSLIIIRGGIYRFNVQPGLTDLLVRKGRVVPGSNPREVIKGGTRVMYATGAPLVAKLSKQDQDEFDLWSKKRAETLARAKQKISGRTVNGYLASMTAFEWAFSAANPWGLWTYSPFSRCFTFMPFRWGWSSPYGHSYGNYYYGGGYYGGPYPTNRGYGTGPTYSTAGSSTGSPGNGSSGGSSGASSSAPTVSAPSAPMGSQAGPRDPDSGSRSINRIKDPNN